MNTDTENTQYQAFETRFIALRRAIEDAIIAAENGKIPPMTKLAFDVEKLCSDVAVCSSEMQHRVQPFMGDVIGLLDTLEYKLRDVKQDLEDSSQN